VKTVVTALGGLRLVIDDGHHRFETSKNFRDERRAESGPALENQVGGCATLDLGGSLFAANGAFAARTRAGDRRASRRWRRSTRTADEPPLGGDMSKDKVIDKHYTRLGSSYNEFLHYSPDFVRTLTEKMVAKLGLTGEDVLADLGCGTGIYAIDLLEQVSLAHPVLGVDPFETMLREIPEEVAIEPICEDALEFSRQPGDYTKVLIKETIHHIEEREELFTNLHRNLPSGGVLLLVHVPPRIEYPLFDAALERCLGWHADPAEMVVQLEATGFEVERETLSYPHEIPKEHYFAMVENCYMSVLTSFEDHELKAGLAEMAERYAGEDVLRFHDRFDYITATKP
jgi:SAM-dependent methyltransferase